MEAVLAELLGRDTGLLHGKGGSMLLTDVEHGVMGSYAIVGAHLTVALGAGWSARYLGRPRVTVVFFGDGTTNIGAFHEALNLAATWRLPVVFVCENNQYMEYTPIRAVTAVRRPAADRAAAYGMEPVLIDGNDADAVFLTAGHFLGRARRGDGPALIEAYTYRSTGHSRADPAHYKPAGEVAAWAAYDPLEIYRRRLLDNDMPAAVLDGIEAEAAAEVDAATAKAKAAPAPGADRLLTNVWADGGSSWRN
jgi:pyruvate dehydrogenase E1 component alpha subunit